MSRAEKAKEYFIQGFNCSQAVALAFADCTDVSEETIGKIMQPFGGGVGRLRLTCGAISGMVAVVGLVFGKNEAGNSKKETYAIVQELCNRFKLKNGSLICEELLTGTHLSGNAEGYKKKPCAELVYDAAQILEEYLTEKGKL